MPSLRLPGKRDVAVLLTALSGLLLLSIVAASQAVGRDAPEQGQTLAHTLQEYMEEGYSKQGPLYVVRVPREGVIEFREHEPVSYDKLEIVDEQGREASLDPVQRVYLLQKEGEEGTETVLINLKTEMERSNV